MSKARCHYCNRLKDSDDMADIDVEDFRGDHGTELMCRACEKNPHWWYRPKCERCNKFVSITDSNVRFHQQVAWDGGIDWDGYVHIVCPHEKKQPTSGGKG